MKSTFWAEKLETPVGKLLLVVFILFVLFSFCRQFFAIYELNEDISALKRDKETLMQEYRAHKEVLATYATQPFIETYARENLEMIYPGEVRMMEAQPNEDLQKTPDKIDEIPH